MDDIGGGKFLITTFLFLVVLLMTIMSIGYFWGAEKEDTPVVNGFTNKTENPNSLVESESFESLVKPEEDMLNKEKFNVSVVGNNNTITFNSVMPDKVEPSQGGISEIREGQVETSTNNKGGTIVGSGYSIHKMISMVSGVVCFLALVGYLIVKEVLKYKRNIELN